LAGGGLTQLDPNKVSSAALLPAMTMLYNGLTKYDQKMNVQPDLATSWSTSADKKTWTFKLRSGVKFHDGRAFTATDAVLNIQRVLDKATGSQARGKLTMVDTVRAVDPQTLEVKLNLPNALLPTALTYVKMSDVPGIARVNQTANGTGPFKLKEFLTDDHLVLVRNDNYFGTKAKLDSVKIVVAADPTSAINSLRNGELDAVWNVPPLDVKGLKTDPGLQILNPNIYSGTLIWELDTTSAPFNDVRARQALAYAANRAQMLSAGYDGHGVADDANGVLNPAQDGYAKDLTKYSHDMAKAKDLFTQAGVKQGSELVFWTASGRDQQWVTMAEILQQDLKSIGINLKIQSNENGTWLQKFFPAGQKYPGVIVANYLSQALDPSIELNFFRTGVCECNWSNKQFDAQLAQAKATEDPATRNGLYGQLQHILNQEVPVIVPMKTAQISVVQNRVVGAWVQTDGALHLEDAGVKTG